MVTSLALRISMVFLMAFAWISGSACFPIFSPRVAEHTRELQRQDPLQEVTPRTAHLFITQVEDHHGGRRFHLVLKDYLDGRAHDSGLVFQYDEGGSLIMVSEGKDLAQVTEVGHPVKILHRSDLGMGDNNQQSVQDMLTADPDGLPNNVLVEPEFAPESIALVFSFRDRKGGISTGHWQFIPRGTHSHPVLAGLNNLNYLWAVPADTVVVVGGWTGFIVVLPFIALSQL